MKLATLNLEGTKHLPDQLAWLAREKPDVVCLQECFRVSLPEFAKLGYRAEYVPLLNVERENRYRVQLLGEWGLAILTRVPVKSSQVFTYRGQPGQLPILTDPNSPNRAALVLEVEIDGEKYTIATAHHTWTSDGETSPEQRRDTVRLLDALKPFPSLILCGDFNAPRGKEAWSMLATQYRDNVPPEVTTTIDGAKHYAGNLQLVVDGIFSTSDYRVENVRVQAGVSDHCALSADVRLA